MPSVATYNNCTIFKHALNQGQNQPYWFLYVGIGPYSYFKLRYIAFLCDGHLLFKINTFIISYQVVL